MKKKQSAKRGEKKRLTESFDAKFDNGESVVDYLDVDKAVRRVNVDFPSWTIAALDRESSRLGISRQALIKVWIIERLDAQAKGRGACL